MGGVAHISITSDPGEIEIESVSTILISLSSHIRLFQPFFGSILVIVAEVSPTSFVENALSLELFKDEDMAGGQ